LSAEIAGATNMRIGAIWLWTDCFCVLKYLANVERRFSIYVTNRLNEIRELTYFSQWNYVPSKDNVADDATRLIDITKLTSKSRWSTGPLFLYDKHSSLIVFQRCLMKKIPK
jgi:hypothetical protein